MNPNRATFRNQPDKRPNLRNCPKCGHAELVHGPKGCQFTVKTERKTWVPCGCCGPETQEEAA